MRRFQSLPAESRSIVFYAEGAADWAHFSPVIDELTGPLGRTICYLTSEATDPILTRRNDRILAFCIGSGAARTWLFRMLSAKVMVMTLPDLDTFHLKRSVNPVHYAYLFHCMNSTHMIYRRGAFDAYTTIFCVGPHHAREIRKTEEVYGLKPKALVEHGCGRLDMILARRQAAPSAVAGTRQPRHVLVAPSWGPCSLLENPCGMELLRTLLDAGYRVTLRMHPMTVRHAPALPGTIAQQIGSPDRFSVETDMTSQASLHDSDVMVSDWSGAALDYAFGLERPVLFVNTPMKINNPEYEKIGITPLEVAVRGEVGDVVEPSQIGDAPSKIDRLCGDPAAFQQRIRDARDRWIYHIGSSGRVGAQALAELADRPSAAGGR